MQSLQRGGNHRLYFTTFAEPVPKPDVLNQQASCAGSSPRIRRQRRPGQIPDDEDEEDLNPYYYFTIDDQLFYLSFYQDWGPLNLAQVYKACILFHELLEVCFHSPRAIHNTC